MTPTVSECRDALRQGRTTPSELLGKTRQRIAATDGAVRAYLRLTDELAEQQAERASRLLEEKGQQAPDLCGVPIALKDVLCVRGVETTAGSQILSGFRPPYTATAVQRLLDAGSIVVGITNCDEFAMGSSTEYSSFFPTGNPWDARCVPGGSSGVSAAAVAAGTVPCSLGSDTGGSIRQPAALCGVAGFKPTYGRVSRYGLIAFASSLDQIGPFGVSVEDCALVYSMIAGHDPLDSTCSDRPLEDPLVELRRGVEGMRLGVPKQYFAEGLEADVRSTVDAALQQLESLGASLEEVSLPSTDVALSTYYIIAPAECSSNLARYDGVRFGMRDEHPSLTETYLQTRRRGFGAEVKRRIMLGTYALSSGYYDAYYRQAQKVRTLISREFDDVFQRVDALVCPTSPTVAFGMGERSDPLAMYACDIMTIPVNLAGLPGMSVPCGLVSGMPVGLQVIGPRFEDARVLRIGYAYEQASTWRARQPPLAEAAATA